MQIPTKSNINCNLCVWWLILKNYYLLIILQLSLFTPEILLLVVQKVHCGQFAWKAKIKRRYLKVHSSPKKIPQFGVRKLISFPIHQTKCVLNWIWLMWKLNKQLMKQKKNNVPRLLRRKKNVKHLISLSFAAWIICKYLFHKIL